jgi:hypothetical protein
MIANALILTIALLLGYGFWLVGQLKFMTPYKQVLFFVLKSQVPNELVPVNPLGLTITYFRED